MGCGRYFKRHAVDHFDKTGHTFSIELNTSRIWNYRGDNYVHRMIKANTDNSLHRYEDQIAYLGQSSNVDQRHYAEMSQETEEQKECGPAIQKQNSSETSSKQISGTFNHSAPAKPVMMSLPDQFIDSAQIHQPEGASASQDPSSSQKYVDDRFIVDKVQNSIFEYNHLLTSQLEEQRNIYEKKLEVI